MYSRSLVRITRELRISKKTVCNVMRKLEELNYIVVMKINTFSPNRYFVNTDIIDWVKENDLDMDLVKDTTNLITEIGRLKQVIRDKELKINLISRHVGMIEKEIGQDKY